MSSESKIILEVCTILAKDLKVSINEESNRESAGAVMFLGALLAGKEGLLTGSAMALGSEIKSVDDVMKNDMDASQKDQLVEVVIDLFTGIDKTDTETVVNALSAHSKKKVVAEISKFFQYKMQMRIFSHC